MGRKSHSRSLSVWANGIRVGTWTLPTRGPAQLKYDDTWLGSEVGRPLSLSLPFTFDNSALKGEKVDNFFDNLLPDSDAIRKRVAARFNTGSVDVFDLLKAIGRDCVGAVQLLGEDEAPAAAGQVEATPLTAADIERHLVETVALDAFADARDPDDDFRISLAGAQEKSALLWWDGQWQRPHGSTPTTHIFKLPIGLVGGQRADFSTSVDNEWLCLRLLRAYGLDAAKADIRCFGKQRVLVVERFDRRLAADGRGLLRLPQEDFCQVQGVSPLRKYESQGGPGLEAIGATLRNSLRARDDIRTLLASQVLFWMLRAPDGHAKNFSVHLLAGGGLQLTPLYDVMSAYPVMGAGPNQWSPFTIKLAMALLGKNRHYLMHDIQRRHFSSTAWRIGFGESAEPVVRDILARTPVAIAEVRAELPIGFSQRVADTVLDGLQDAAHALERMPQT